MAICFEYTVEYPTPEKCKDGGGTDWNIPFTGSSPDGYHGRFCSNNPYSADVGNAIVFLRDGGNLSELDSAARTNYLDAVDLVMDELEAECRTAAPGQCVDEAQVCAGIAADMFAALVTNETCVLEPGGEVEHQLQGLEQCYWSPVFYGFATEGSDYCTDDTSGLDTTAGVDTTAGADSTTGEMADPPFGDLEELVSCDPQTSCDVDRQLLINIQANYEVFLDDEVTLTIVDSSVQCGPGAQIGGLDSSEDSKELADAFDLRNGDIIRQIESTYILDMEDAAAAVSSLLQDPSTTVVVRRSQGSGCDSLTYDIDVQ